MTVPCLLLSGRQIVEGDNATALLCYVILNSVTNRISNFQ